MDDDRLSTWRQAQAVKDRDLIARVIQLTREYSETWGRWPSVTEVLALLHPPS